MFSTLHNLLTTFFNANDAGAVPSGSCLQLATAVLLFDVMRSDANTSDAERAQA